MMTARIDGNAAEMDYSSTSSAVVGRCRQCGANTTASLGADKRRRPFKFYCTKKCASKAYAKKHGKFGVPNLPTGTVGTISELKIAVDLLLKKYEVYRPLTPNCSGDLLVERDGEFKKIEVRSAYKNPTSGKLQFPPYNIRANILATYVHAVNEINYFNYPELTKIDL